ncbi:hypothetical protein Vretifemale_715, partial [Volvox reticuliferus]
GATPLELPYGSLPLELPQELLGLRCLEHLELYGIPLAPPRGCTAHLSCLSLLTSLHLAGSAPSLVRSAAHLTHLIALRRLVLRCTALGVSEPWPEPGLMEHAGGLEVAQDAAAAAQPPPAAPPGPAGGATTAGRHIVAMLSTNSLLFLGLQRLAEAGVSLTELSYRGFFLTLPPPYLRQWSSLESLDLSCNTLMLDGGMLETQVACLTHLTYLDLSNNRLDELPAQLCRALSRLRCLNLSCNPISHLPADLSLLSALTRLRAAGSCLVGLPPEICTLSCLRHLDVSGNRLESLPEWLSRLSRLELLQVSCNRLDSIPGLRPSWGSQVHSTSSSAPSSSPVMRATAAVGSATAATSPSSSPTCASSSPTATATAPSTASDAVAASVSTSSTAPGAELRCWDVDGLQRPDGEEGIACSCPRSAARSVTGFAATAVSTDTGAAATPSPAPAPLPFPALTHLDFSSNRLDLLPLAAIGRMSRLTTLAFGQNCFKACLPDPTVATTTATTTTSITRVPDAAVADAPLQPLGGVPAPSLCDLRAHLVELDIRMAAGFLRGAAGFLEDVGRLTALTRLNAQSNALQALPPSWTCLTHLVHLDLSLNALTHLPPGLSALHRLRHLSAASNRMTCFPAAAAAVLSGLTFLDLSLNLLEDLPKELGEVMTRLRVLDLHYNALCSLPLSITRLVRLRKIDVSRNDGLKELPYGMAELSCLTLVVVGKALMDQTQAAVGSGTGAAAGPASSSGKSSSSCYSQVGLLAARGVRVQVAE